MLVQSRRHMRRRGGGPTTLTISANTSNYNIANALGNPASPLDVELTINSGVVVGSTSTATASLATGSLPAGSTVTVINNGYIIGKGGFGGGPNNGSAYGEDGGNAIDAQLDITIDNTNGNIFGGGGGGSGGPYATVPHPTFGCAQIVGCVAGGGGGGGAGSPGGIGGADNDQSGTCTAASDGTSGGDTGGPGGAGAVGGGATGGNGGPGGGYGQDGGPSTASSGCNASAGIAGGLAGKAIELNGNTVTWIGGNNSTQVKGAVS